MRSSSFAVTMFAIYLTLSVAAISAEAQRCGDSAIDRSLIADLFEYSLLEQWAFQRNMSPRPSCASDGHRYDLSTPNYRAIYAGGIKSSELEDAFANSELPIVVYSEGLENGQVRYHLSCVTNRPIPQLAASGSIIVKKHVEQIEHYEVKSYSLGFAIDITLVVPDSLREAVRALSEEEIEFVQASRVARGATSGDLPDNMFFIRGTDLAIEHLYYQIASSVKGALGESCVFPAAAKLVSHISMSRHPSVYPYPPLSVVGHSLGGTVAQYIAYDRQNSRGAYPLNFTAYSFNGMGLPGKETEVEDLLSYVVNGDWLDLLRQAYGLYLRARGREGLNQYGKRLTYFPNSIEWLFRERHTIDAVQSSLCRCYELKKGRIEIAGGS